MKHEWRKKEKEYYIPKAKPEIKNIPQYKFLTIKGEGNPNGEEFKKRIETLYSISYCIKMMPRKGIELEGYFDYTVYPLEGIWDLNDEGRKEKVINKDNLIYTIMIRQPDFVNEDIVKQAIEMTKKKKSNDLLDNVKLETIEEGMCVQMLHIGSFDDEAKTIKVMEKYCEENNLIIKTKAHREIYLSDFRKTATEKLKTVLRYKVKENI